MGAFVDAAGQPVPVRRNKAIAPYDWQCPLWVGLADTMADKKLANGNWSRLIEENPH